MHPFPAIKQKIAAEKKKSNSQCSKPITSRQLMNPRFNYLSSTQIFSAPKQQNTHNVLNKPSMKTHNSEGKKNTTYLRSRDANIKTQKPKLKIKLMKKAEKKKKKSTNPRQCGLDLSQTHEASQ